MTNVMPILSDFQEGTRNAKVYKAANGEYGVIVYDSESDYNGFDSFATEQLAEEFAEDWVLRASR